MCRCLLMSCLLCCLVPAGRAAEAKLDLVLQTGHASAIFQVSLSGDGSRALTGSLDRTAILWDTKTGEKIRAFEGHTSYIFGVSLSHDGSRALTSARDDYTAILWDAKTGEKLQT